MDLVREAARRGRDPGILVTRLRYLGDVILTTPVISALRKRYPEARIHYLVEEVYAPVLGGNPFLDGVIELGMTNRSFARTVLRIRKMKFTAALDLFYNPRSANLLFLSGIPVRIGGARRWRKRLYTDTFEVPRKIRSAVMHHLYPLGILDCDADEDLPRIYLDDREKESGAELVEKAAFSGERRGPVVAIHPGGTWPSKIWPAGSFAALSAMLVGKFDAKVVVITGPGEEKISSSVADRGGEGVYSLPVLPLRVVASIMNACDAVIANDGGVLHMAVSLGRPTVGIFGPTEPDIWFPYEGKGPFALATRREKCAPCHLHYCENMKCLDKIEVDDIIDKLSSVTGW